MSTHFEPTVEEPMTIDRLIEILRAAKEAGATYVGVQFHIAPELVAAYADFEEVDACRNAVEGRARTTPAGYMETSNDAIAWAMDPNYPGRLNLTGWQSPKRAEKLRRLIDQIRSDIAATVTRRGKS